MLEKGKYPDVYIFLPKKGIKAKRPVMGLDFASLYFSFIMIYNFFSEKIILSLDEANCVKENGNSLYLISFLFNKYDIYAWCVRHDN